MDVREESNSHFKIGYTIMLLLTKSVTPETSHWLMSNENLDIPWNKFFIDLFLGILVSKHHFSGGL